MSNLKTQPCHDVKVNSTLGKQLVSPGPSSGQRENDRDRSPKGKEEL